MNGVGHSQIGRKEWGASRLSHDFLPSVPDFLSQPCLTCLHKNCHKLINNLPSELPDGALAPGVRNCGCAQAGGCILLTFRMPKWKSWITKFDGADYVPKVLCCLAVRCLAVRCLAVRCPDGCSDARPSSPQKPCPGHHQPAPDIGNGGVCDAAPGYQWDELPFDLDGDLQRGATHGYVCERDATDHPAERERSSHGGKLPRRGHQSRAGRAEPRTQSTSR